MKINANRLHQIYSIFLSALSIIVGGLFIFHILYIYVTGSQSSGDIFTREIVGKHLLQMLMPVCLLVIAIIGGLVLQKFFIPDQQKDKIRYSKVEMLKKISNKINLQYDKETCVLEIEEIKKLRLYRYISFALALLVCLLSIIFCLLYAINLDNYSEDAIKDILSLVLFFAPFIIASFGVMIAYVIVEEIFASKEFELSKKVMAKGGIKLPTIKTKKINDIWIGRGILFALAVSFIIIGAVNGDIEDVLRKAIVICAECIGLG